MVDNLEIFLKEAVGRIYGLDTSKLLRKQTIKKSSTSEIIDENRTFFCSELIAKAFKVLGILVNDEVSCS